MRFMLKDYQDDAVEEVLRNLADARDDWHRRHRPVAFSLTATTGAGKTVMAAAVIEALFEGNDDYDFEPDPGAVVLWFTDDPSLNEQTRFRLMEAADRIGHSRLVVIENTFNQEKLEPGKVYFLNAQKLSRNSMLVRGAPEEEQEPLIERSVMPDARSFTMWDTIRNTIENDQLTLYVILDEAHRGMKQHSASDRAERSTIVTRLINGVNGDPPGTIVWGISATVDRFNQAMAKAEGRTSYPPIVVDSRRVQESGLLKDDIRLGFPAISGQFDTVLLKQATRKAKETTALWQKYAAGKDDNKELVIPLLVVQVPNTPSDDLLLSAFNTISDEWPELAPNAMAHVFGEHTVIELGAHAVPHVSPEKVQESTHVRVLFAKDAVSTGWDCPRAEVLVSFRAAQDKTHITQLLGRMVRTPLARRVPGDDRLNSVECVLPHFNRATATTIAEMLLGKKA
ncbi:MAG: DEAD/DEAH box helicase family protein, partial [Acidobacteriaceae bacterium]|nr:DEAD/DEAH box helicase family protein [Acidobacteriaceae bacterium]